MIPRKLFSIWLNDDPIIPEPYKSCIESQRRMAEQMGWGYELLIGPFRDPYMIFYHEAIRAKKWVKAADYLRMHVLRLNGGVYLDADTELLKPIPEEWLNHKLFTVQQSQGIFSNGMVGAEADNPLLKEYCRRLDENFKGDGELVFEPGIRAFADLIWLEVTQGTLEKNEILILPPETFFEQTENSIGHHKGGMSWIKDPSDASL